jgi:hypothetical protein
VERPGGEYNYAPSSPNGIVTHRIAETPFNVRCLAVGVAPTLRRSNTTVRHERVVAIYNQDKPFGSAP